MSNTQIPKVGIFGSKKFWMTVVGAAIAAVAHVTGLSHEELAAVVAPFVAYVLGQGIADNGKEKAKVEAEEKKASDLEALLNRVAALEAAQNTVSRSP